MVKMEGAPELTVNYFRALRCGLKYDCQTRKPINNIEHARSQCERYRPHFYAGKPFSMREMRMALPSASSCSGLYT